MRIATDRTQAPTAIRTNLGAIFLSMDLSRTTWLKAQIGRELDRLELILQQISSVETERDALLSPSKDGAPAPGAMLKSLKGIGPEFAGVLWSEGLYRSFSNRRQVAAYAGLGPTPWQSGSVVHEQGVSKPGTRGCEQR